MVQPSLRCSHCVRVRRGGNVVFHRDRGLGRAMCLPTSGPAQRTALATTLVTVVRNIGPCGAFGQTNTLPGLRLGRQAVRYDMIACPTSLGSGSWSQRGRLPVMTSSPRRQSMLSSRSDATSPMRSPSRQHGQVGPISLTHVGVRVARGHQRPHLIFGQGLGQTRASFTWPWSALRSPAPPE
jgi:hypothetical protein